MYKDFFEKYKLGGAEKLSEDRRRKIGTAVLSRVKEEKRKSERCFRFKPVFAAAAAAVAAIAGVTVGALSSPPFDIKINGTAIEPYFDTYTDSDGAVVEIIGIAVPERLLTEEVEGKTPAGKVRLLRFDSEEQYPERLPCMIDENGEKFFTSINNMLIQTTVTYPDGKREGFEFDVSNKNESYDYKMFWLPDNTASYFFPFTLNICGEEISPEYDITADRDGAFVETLAVKLPDCALKEELQGLTPVGRLGLKRLDDELNSVEPCLIDENGTEFPLGVNNVYVEAKVTYRDGSSETFKFGASNAADGFDMNEAEMEFSLIV